MQVLTFSLTGRIYPYDGHIPFRMDRVPEGNGPQRLQDHNDALAARLREEDEDVRCRVRIRI